jgi:hypothetical protein
MQPFVVVLLALVFVLIVVLAGSPAVHGAGQGVEDMGHREMDRQFERPGNEGDLL